MCGMGWLTMALITIIGCNKAPDPKASGSTTPDAGYLEKVDCQTVVGWAWAKDRPDETIGVDILDGSVLLGTVKADIPRADLAVAKIGNGKHGFTYTLPATIRDGKAHVIHTRISGKPSELGQSPITVTCPGT